MKVLFDYQIFSQQKYHRQLINPFFDFTLFVGGKYGAFLKLKYEILSGKNKNVWTSIEYPTGWSDPIYKNGDVKINVSQIELKLGLYLPKK